MKSDAIKRGPENASHRLLYHALGWTDEEIERPLVGIASSFNEVVPGHMNIDKVVEAVKMGVAMAGPGCCTVAASWSSLAGLG